MSRTVGLRDLPDMLSRACWHASKLAARTSLPAARRASRTLTSASDSLEAWIQERKAEVKITHDVLDPLRAMQLHRTLPVRQPSAKLHTEREGAVSLDWRESRDGDGLPNGHHMAYFQPVDWFHQLAPDGTSTVSHSKYGLLMGAVGRDKHTDDKAGLTVQEYNAPQPYTMRMWAGGSMRWNPDLSKRLKIGSTVTQALSVERVEIKKNMVFVYQRRDLYPGMLDPDDQAALDPDGWAMSEIRSHAFRQPQAVSAASTKPKANLITSSDPSTWSYRTSYTPTSPLLFRFSALTFNGHKIHYDREWTREKEGHPDLVVHGPMNAVLLVELASAVASRRGKRLLSFDYRATSPMYVDQEISLLARPDEAQGAEWNRLVLEAQQGDRVGMMATAILGA